MAKTTKLLTAAELNSYRSGDFALIQDLDGRFRVQNLRTGTKSRPFPKARALRILKEAAR